MPKPLPIPSADGFSPTVIDKSLANETNTIKSRCPITIVRVYGPPLIEHQLALSS